MTLRRLLVSPLEWLQDNDPCYTELLRAAHIGLGFVLGILAGVVTNSTLALGLSLQLPMFVALGAVAHPLFLTPSNRRHELRDLARLSTFTLGYVLLAAAIGPGSLAAGTSVMKLLLVPTTFVALYLRRFGLAQQKAGTALFVVAVIVSVVEPTRAQGLWLLLAVAEGTAIAYALRLSPFRPSAAARLEAIVAAYSKCLAAVLRCLAGELRAGASLTRVMGDDVLRLRRRARAAALAAVEQAPERRLTFDHIRALGYRLQLATAILLEAVPEPRQSCAAVGAVRPRFVAIIDVVGDIIAGASDAAPRLRTLGEELNRLRDELLEEHLIDNAERYGLLRATAALERLHETIAELAGVLTSGHIPASDTQPATLAPAVVSAPDGLRPTTRVAIQGLVATGITTALDLGLGLTHAYWATLAVVFVIGNSFGETVTRARHRTLGTAAGVLLGIVVASALSEVPWLLAVLCIVAQMLAALVVQRRYELTSAAVGFSVAIGLNLIAGLGVEGMLARIYETAIGAGVALVVSWLIVPVYGGDQARWQIVAILSRCRAAFAAWWPYAEPAVPDAEAAIVLVRELVQVEERLPYLNAEAVLGNRPAGEVVRLATYLNVLETYLTLIEMPARRLIPLSDLGSAGLIAVQTRAEVLAAFDAAVGEGEAATGDEAAGRRPNVADEVAKLAQWPELRPVLIGLVEFTTYGEALARALRGLAAALQGRAAEA